MSHKGEIVAGADRGAVHRRDDRHLELLEGDRDALDTVEIPAPRLDRRRVCLAARRSHLLDVAAAREGRARAGQDGDAHAEIGVEPGQRINDRVDHFRVGDRIATLRRVQRERHHRSVLLVQQHQAPLPQCANRPRQIKVALHVSTVSAY